MPSNPSSTNGGDIRCPQCGTVVPAGSTVCWLCYKPLATTPVQPTAALAAAPDLGGGYSLASLMMFVTLACVVLGLSTIAPGAGIPLGIVLLLVWLRTAAVTRRRAARGLAITTSEQLQLFAASFGVTAILLTLVGIAGFATFWAACFTCMGTYFGLESVVEEGVAMWLAWIMCGAVTVLALFLALKYGLPFIIRLVRSRWQRDIGETAPAYQSAYRVLFIVIGVVLVGAALVWIADMMNLWRM